MYPDQVDVNLLSQGLVLKVIDEPFLMHLFQTIFLVLQHNGSSPSRMDSGNNIREVAFKVVDVGDGLINIFLNLLDDIFQLLVVDGEVVFEHSDSLFAGFGENGCYFVDEVYFGDQHSSEEGSDQYPVLEVSVDSDSVKPKCLDELFEVSESVLGAVVGDVTVF